MDYTLVTMFSMTLLLIAGLIALVLLATRREESGLVTVTPPNPIGPPIPAPRVALPGGHEEWDNQIRYAAFTSGLPDGAGPLILKAIIEHESAHTWNPEIIGDFDQSRCPEEYPAHPRGFRPGRGLISTAGWCSLGLMQIHRFWHPFEARTYDLLDGNQNILAGAYLVVSLWNSFADWSAVLAAYNGGPDAGAAWPNVPAQVQTYVANVGGTFRRYAGLAGVVV